jgi:hypothetical protein
VTLAVPPLVAPEKTTEQVPAESVHVVLLREPPVLPGSRVNVTVPVGVLDGFVVSVTVAVQVEDSLCLILLGTQDTEIEVLSMDGPVTVIVAGVDDELPLWDESPP